MFGFAKQTSRFDPEFPMFIRYRRGVAVCRSMAHPVLPVIFPNKIPFCAAGTYTHALQLHESVRSNAKLFGFAGVTYWLVLKVREPPTSPAVCAPLPIPPWLVPWLALGVLSLICGAVPLGSSARWYTARKLLFHVPVGAVCRVLTPELPYHPYNTVPLAMFGRLTHTFTTPVVGLYDSNSHPGSS